MTNEIIIKRKNQNESAIVRRNFLRIEFEFALEKWGKHTQNINLLELF